MTGKELVGGGCWLGGWVHGRVRGDVVMQAKVKVEDVEVGTDQTKKQERKE